MYCVIQEIKKQKENTNGYYKKLEACKMLSGYYYYEYTGGRFERPVKKAYKISLHQSYRENGKIKKKQYAICTVDYYDFATNFFSLYDWGDSKIQKVSEEQKIDIEELYQLILEKIEPLQEQIINKFRQTEEYKTHEEHEKITTLYAVNKMEFAEKYKVNKMEYDRCYNVFGEVVNAEYLKKIKSDYIKKEEYEQKSRSYQEQYYSNYNQSSSSYHSSFSSTYDDEDKKNLKKFYRELSKRFHPDSNQGADTSKEMQLLNKLKQEWGI